MSRSVVQLLGLLMLAGGGWLLWSPWSLVIAGGVLVVGPEVVALVEAARRPVQQPKGVERA